MRILSTVLLFAWVLLSAKTVHAGSDPFAYFPMVPMEKDYVGLGNKIHVHEVVRPVSFPGGPQGLEIRRTIVYLNFPPKTIVSTYAFDPLSGAFSKRSSTSAFSSQVFEYNPPLTRLVLPFAKGKTWSGRDGQNTLSDSVWGKVRVTLPAGTFVCWVVRRKLTYDLISRRSKQILYDYYARGIGFVGEGGWSATGRWHWSRQLLSYRMEPAGTAAPAR
jgi:hypothetical protein